MKWLKKDMGYRRELIIWLMFTLAILLGVVAWGIQNQFNGCGVELRCFRRLLTSTTYSHLFMPFSVVLLTLIPLFFTKEGVYRAWKKFTIIYIPIALYLIFTSSTGGIQFITANERESVTYALSTLFLIISFLIIIIKSWKLRGKKA